MPPTCRRAVELLFPMFSLRASAVRCASAQYWGMVFLAITEKDYLVRSKCQADGQSYNTYYNIYIYTIIYIILCVYAYMSRDPHTLPPPSRDPHTLPPSQMVPPPGFSQQPSRLLLEEYKEIMVYVVFIVHIVHMYR